MAFKDSIDKIVLSYFAVVTKHDFIYKGKIIKAKPLKVSPLIVRGFTCPENCAACCSSVFSLDYLPEELFPQKNLLVKRDIIFNNSTVEIFSDKQENKKDPFCQYVDEKGRCQIHGYHPFSCDFELIRTSIFSQENRRNLINQKLYGRGWNMKRIDGIRGALCKMTPPSLESIQEVIRKLKRLQQWCDHFGIDSYVPEIITTVKNHKLLF